MENIWSDGIVGERKDLAPIMEEEDKGQAKGFSLISFSIFWSLRGGNTRNRKNKISSGQVY